MPSTLKLKKVKSFTISRRRWGRGWDFVADHGSQLRQNLKNKSKPVKMCCLGFYCLAAGLSPDDILDVATPEDINTDLLIPGLTKKLSDGTIGATLLTDRAVEINDCNDALRTFKEIEAELTALFKRHKIRVKFVP